MDRVLLTYRPYINADIAERIEDIKNHLIIQNFLDAEFLVERWQMDGNELSLGEFLELGNLLPDFANKAQKLSDQLRKMYDPQIIDPLRASEITKYWSKAEEHLRKDP
ncbi:hypothetical protein EPICR_120044 [Candidatus Desulfarcum epimagneticum]|uniref:Uncharacterized protein n=1 Tax=uncultured Desulfobacteraceae bacterium TaxID=218296 RepID=A0A484HF67_9BACT|nr:hypothetical protein EPICR_120044 [uncultured Desulfobacteraceae bacterium]